MALLACRATPNPSVESPEAAADRADEAPERSERSGGEAEGIFLSMLKASVHERAKLLAATAANDEAFAKHLRVRLHVMKAYREFGELSRRTGTRAVNGIFQVSDLSQLSSLDRPARRDRQSSFVVDFDQASIAQPARELSEGREPVSAARVSAFVGEYIDDKTYARGFDIASRVASTRSGDCTEHAVLAAALLRRFDLPARLVFGIVLVGLSEPDSAPAILAAGHAWVEQYDGERWHIVDAALNPESTGPTERRTGVPGLPAGARLRLAYLPITVMRDESASFSRALMDEAGVDAVVGVEVDAIAEGPE